MAKQLTPAAPPVSRRAAPPPVAAKPPAVAAKPPPVAAKAPPPVAAKPPAVALKAPPPATVAHRPPPATTGGVAITGAAIVALNAEIERLKATITKQSEALAKARTKPDPLSAKDVYERAQPTLAAADDWRIPIVAYAIDAYRSGAGPTAVTAHDYDAKSETWIIREGLPPILGYFAIPHDTDPPEKGGDVRKGGLGTSARAQGMIAFHCELNDQDKATTIRYYYPHEYAAITGQAGEAAAEPEADEEGEASGLFYLPEGATLYEDRRDGYFVGDVWLTVPEGLTMALADEEIEPEAEPTPPPAPVRAAKPTPSAVKPLPSAGKKR